MVRGILRKAPMAVLALLGLSLMGCHFPVTFWPIEPTGSVHPIGNSGGEFQQYGGSPYFHTGIDIMEGSAPGGPFVRTVRAGVPTLSLPGASSTQNGLTVVHSDGSVYLYWHLDLNSVTQAARDAEDAGTMAANTQIARLHVWPACGYHHLHYETGDSAGKEDPIWSLTPRSETTSPAIVNVFFTQNTTDTQFPTEALGRPILSGNVDVIAHAYDTQFGMARTGVMSIRYKVTSSTGATIKTGRTINFTKIPASANASIIYRNSGSFDSDSNYCGTENYYYVLTNIDASGNFNDTFGWDTTAHPDGIYNVEVKAWDSSSNFFALTKQVRIDN